MYSIKKCFAKLFLFLQYRSLNTKFYILTTISLLLMCYEIFLSHWHCFVAHLVLYPDGYSNSPDVAVFVDFHFQGKILSRFFCVGTTLGKNHPFRNGIPAKNKAFTETGKEEEL